MTADDSRKPKKPYRETWLPLSPDWDVRVCDAEGRWFVTESSLDDDAVWLRCPSPTNDMLEFFKVT